MESILLYFLSQDFTYFAILGGSLKKTAKNITISVPVNKKTYTKASILNLPCLSLV
jgi:hypothetical protein